MPIHSVLWFVQPEGENTIGYSLPANLLGQPGDTLPFPPWESSSVCTNKTCKENPNLCYRATRHVPVIHGEEVTKKVQYFDVTGVSLVQEASNKPANVFVGIEADDDTGNIVCYIKGAFTMVMFRLYCI